MQNIHQNRKAEQENDPDKMNHGLHLAVDRLFPDPFDDAEHHLRAVQRGDRQQVEHRQIDADKCGNVEEGQNSARRGFGRRLNRRHSPAHVRQTHVPLQKLPQRTQNQPAELCRIHKRIADRLKEILFDGRSHQRIVLFYPQRSKNRVYIRHVFEICVRF